MGQIVKNKYCSTFVRIKTGQDRNENIGKCI